jgi:hypothetical protein
MIECFEYMSFSDGFIDFLLRHAEYFDLFEDTELLAVSIYDKIAFSIGSFTEYFNFLIAIDLHFQIMVLCVHYKRLVSNSSIYFHYKFLISQVINIFKLLYYGKQQSNQTK